VTPTDKPDYYAVLGVPTGADPARIKSAYRKLASTCHPDKNPDNRHAQDQFIEIQQAYRVLCDPARRARYDHSLQSGRPEPALLQKSRTMIDSFVKNLRAAAGNWPRRGRDLRYSLSLELGDAARGGRFRLPVGDSPLEVTVPAGIEDGTRLKIEGQGDPGSGGGNPGDLIVEIRLTPHPLLTRRGPDLHCLVPVPLPTAALGGPIQVPTLEGPDTVHLPAGTRDGGVLRIPGRGMPQTGGDPRGDLVIAVKTEVPVGLSAEMRKLLSSFADACGTQQFPEVARYRKVLDSLLILP